MPKISFVLAALTCILLLWAPTCISQVLNAEQVRNLLSNRTFIEKNLKQDKLLQLYFSPEGKFTMVYPSRTTTKTGKWKVENNGDLCMEYSIKKSKKIKSEENNESDSVDSETDSGTERTYTKRTFIEKCGKIVRTSEEIFKRFDTNGNPIAILQYTGNGNLLKIGR